MLNDRLNAVLWPLVGGLVTVALLQAAPAVVDTLARVIDTAPPEPSRPAPLVWFGLHPDRLFAGAAGGYIHMLSSAPKPGTTIRTWALSVLAGALMGNYLPLVARGVWPALGALPEAARLGIAFVLGYAGFALLEKLQPPGLAAQSRADGPDGAAPPRP